MSKKIKLLSLCAAIGAISYGSAVYLFNANAQRILNNTFQKIDDMGIVQSIKERVEINAFKFQVNFLSSDKGNTLLNVYYNPLTSNAHLYYVSPIEEKITIEEGKEIAVKFTLDKPKYLLSIKTPRNLNGYQNIIDLLIDENFYISDINKETCISTIDMEVTQTGFDIPEILDTLPLSIKCESDTRSAEFKRDGQKVTFGCDVAYQIAISTGKAIPRTIKGSSDSSLTLNAQALMHAVSKTVQSGKIENWTPEQKEQIANDVIQFFKDLKVKYKIKEEKTIGASSDKMMTNIEMNNIANNQLLFNYTMTGTSTSKGRNEILRASLSDDMQVNQLLSVVDEGFNTQSTTEKEKSKKELSDILYNTVVVGDDVNYSAHLNLALKSNSDKTVLENGTTLVKSIESYQVPGEYELDVSFASAIGENFALAIEGMLSYKDFAPHADLKITFNKESHKQLLNFFQRLTIAAKGTNFHKSANAYFAMIQSFPYDALFKAEKNPKTDKEDNVFQIQF
jgi:hypothetical protein